MTDLPPGWTNITLREAGPLVGGKTPSKSSSAYWNGGSVYWTSPKDMKSFVLTKSEDMITPHAVRDAGMEVLPADAVLMVTRSGILAHTFPVALTAMETAINQDIKALRPSQGLIPRYTAYALKAFGREILSQCSKEGTTVASVNTDALETFPLPLAPHKEQKRIADKLDVVLSTVDACRARLDRVPQILKKFREAVLEAAVSGRLTEEWREGQSIAKRHDEIPTDWVSSTFDQITDSSLYGPRFSSDDYIPDGVPTLRTTDMDAYGRLTPKDPPRVKISTDHLERLGLKDGDLLMTRTGATIGKCAVYDSALGPALPSAYLIRFRLKQHQVLPRYALLFLLSPSGQRLLFEGSTSFAQPNINARKIRTFPLALPTLTEQLEIVRRVDRSFAYSDAMQRRYEEALTTIDKLTPSVLAKAFRGELVPQDPTDEPAGEMLGRVRQQLSDRVDQKNKTKDGRRTLARPSQAGAAAGPRRVRQSQRVNPRNKSVILRTLSCTEG